MRTEGVDLVHGFTIKCAVYGSIAGLLADVPARISAVAGMGYVFTSNDLRARVLRPVVRWLLRIALDGPGARLILQNPDDVRLFEKARLVATHRIRLIPSSGVDCDKFSPCSPPQPGKPNAMRVLLPARMLWDKGVGEFVEAARLLKRQGRDIHFLLAGAPDSGNPASVPESTLRAWGEEGTVQWLGHVDDMVSLFRSVDVAVLPSYREGLPRGLVEAGACGLPLITTDAPGCREIVTDGVNGFLVPIRDSVTLARAIGTLDDDPGLRFQLGAAARETILQRFDERLVIAQTLSVYEEMRKGINGEASRRLEMRP